MGLLRKHLPSLCTKHAHRGVKSYRVIEIEGRVEVTEHKDVTNSSSEVTEVKPQALDHSINNPENDAII